MVRVDNEESNLFGCLYYAGVVKLADTPDLGSGDASRGGSSPSARTIPLPKKTRLQVEWNIEMQVEKVLSDKLKHQFKVTALEAELRQKYDAQLQKISTKAKIPGFRPGKIPASILEQRYGDEAWHDAGNAVLREALNQIYKENSFRNAIEPAMDIVSFDKGKDFECMVTFETMPEIQLKDFKDISVERLAVTIEDQDVEDRLGKIHREHSRYQEPSPARAAEKGDLVTVKWSGVLKDGQSIEMPKTYQILLGSENNDSPFEPIVTALYGKKIGDHFEEKIHFPKSEKSEELAGKEAVIKGEVEKVEEPLSFKLDDAFAKEFNIETLEELRKSVRSSLEHEAKKVAHLYTKRHLLDALDKQYDFDLPPTMVDNEFKAIWDQLQRELTEAKASGDLTEEDEMKSEDELRSDYETIAKRRVRLGLLISHLSEAHKINLKEDEVRMAIFQEATRYPSQMKEVISYYTKNDKALRNLVAPLLEDKVVDFILNQSSRKERSVNFPTLKQVVRGVIPTPYDDEEMTTEAPKKETKAASKKSTSEKEAEGKKGKKA